MGVIDQKVAFVFPGQASQYVGMCREFLSDYPAAGEMFDNAASILGVDLKKVCLEGPAETLVKTMYTQPAIFVHSCIADRFLAENGIRPDFVAGHSLGEISALVCAGVLSFEDGLRIVAERSRAMQDDCDNNPGTMTAVLGLDIEAIKQLCDGIDGIVQPANFNSPGQIAVSGEMEAIQVFEQKAQEAGARRVVRLPVGGAYHSPLMASTPDRLANLLEGIRFSSPAFPVMANVTGKFYQSDLSPAKYLVEQIQSPVLWHPSVELLLTAGVSSFVEVGPGKVLQGLIKRTARNACLASLEKPEQLDSVRKMCTTQATQ